MVLAPRQERSIIPPALFSIDYSEGAGAIILGANASLIGWGATLMEIRDPCQPIRAVLGGDPQAGGAVCTRAQDAP